jgi:RNA polymerase sigma-70 factor (ECF subfamily)
VTAPAPALDYTSKNVPAENGSLRCRRFPGPGAAPPCSIARNLEAFHGDERRFRSWVFTIAYRRLADERRRRARRPDLEPLDARDDFPAPVDVEADADRSLASARVRDLCERLIPSQRDVLVLRLFGQMTVEEVARALGKSPRAVKALQRRGYAAIAGLLDHEGATL